MINDFITAIRTLTRIPIYGNDTDNFASSLFWFPLVGFLLAVILFAVAALFQFFFKIQWVEAVAFFVLLVSVVITGALHLDGFADWADALGVLGNREKMLAVMKDSNNGAFGLIAVFLLLLAKWIVLVKLLEINLLWFGLVTAYVSSRSAMVYLSFSLPYARAKGGTGKAFVEGAAKKHLLISLILSIIVLSLFVNILSIIFFFSGFIIAYFWKRWCLKYLGGITGDLLGAGSEFVETILFFLIVFFANYLKSLLL